MSFFLPLHYCGLGAGGSIPLRAIVNKSNARRRPQHCEELPLNLTCLQIGLHKNVNTLLRLPIAHHSNQALIS